MQTVTPDQLNSIFDENLRTDMTDSNITASMQSIFANYLSILSRHGLSRVIQKSQKVAVHHDLGAIRPVNLGQRLEAVLTFSHHALKKNFSGCLQHVVTLANAYQLVDAGEPSKKPKETEAGCAAGGDPGGHRSGSIQSKVDDNNDSVDKVKKLPKISFLSAFWSLTGNRAFDAISKTARAAQLTKGTG